MTVANDSFSTCFLVLPGLKARCAAMAIQSKAGLKNRTSGQTVSRLSETYKWGRHVGREEDKVTSIFQLMKDYIITKSYRAEFCCLSCHVPHLTLFCFLAHFQISPYVKRLFDLYYIHLDTLRLQQQLFWASKFSQETLNLWNEAIHGVLRACCRFDARAHWRLVWRWDTAITRESITFKTIIQQNKVIRIFQ